MRHVKVFSKKNIMLMATSVAVVLLLLSGAIAIGRPAVARRADTVAPSTLAAPADHARAGISETYGKLPLSFEANRGQTDGQVKFLTRGAGYALFFSQTEAVLVLSQPKAREPRPRHALPRAPPKPCRA